MRRDPAPDRKKIAFVTARAVEEKDGVSARARLESM